MPDNNCIVIKGARANNLKNIDVKIPRDKFVVITGLSGSGKSSLAFDTLYAEGQRRYVESLSAYARQFMGRMSKPECDYIKGIPPAIAIEQRVNTRNPRSTVGTSTEIYEYLRLLFARVGRTYSPISGTLVKKHQVSDVMEDIMKHPVGTRFALFAPIAIPEGRSPKEQLAILQKEGYARVLVDGQLYRVAEVLGNEALCGAPFELLNDRLSVSDDAGWRNLVGDSMETAFFEGKGGCLVRFYADGSTEPTETHEFSNRFEADGMRFEEPSDLMFSFNNPLGACPRCEGFGRIVGIDENLVVPDQSLSVYGGAVLCWKGEVMGEWLQNFLVDSERYQFPIHKPYFQLTRAEKDLLWHGAKGVKGIDAFFKYVEGNVYKIQYRVMLARYRGKTECPVCHGARLRPEALYVRVGGKNISEIVRMPITEAGRFFSELTLNEHDQMVGKRLLTEIRSRLQFLNDVGLGYLTLDRLSNSLSGGESQRINLATSLGSSLVGSLYILDEPSIGLHSRDTDLLINVLKRLRDLGNTVVVVEHDEEIIRAADYIIDIGPLAGRLGGRIVFEGDAHDLPQKSEESYTVRYLTGEDRIPLPPFHRPWNNYIMVHGARKNNLKQIDVRFPLQVMTVVTGVSGSGKSTLVRDVFYESLRHYFERSSYPNVDCARVDGDLRLIEAVEYVDQNVIGKSSRSNPVTYIGAYDDIRQLFADQPLAKQLGYPPAYFSFNKEGGRCEECKGEGKITVEMQFMADLTLECDACHGKRFKSEVLEIEYRGYNIYDILEMTINQAIEFFNADTDTTARRIARQLLPLQAVGLGYLKMGQTSSTLSGGENQRVKLAYYLAQERQRPTLFIFDEPTTGLHFHDIRTLLKAFDALISNGHTVLIVEHNLDVIKRADYVIDLGPEGGAEGGHLVVAGTPEEVAACPTSYTGRFLAEKIKADRT